MYSFRKRLGINDWLELIKEDPNLSGAYISISQYIYLIDKEYKKHKETIVKAISFIEMSKQHEYRNGNLNEYYLELNEKEMTELLNILKEVEDNAL